MDLEGSEARALGQDFTRIDGHIHRLFGYFSKSSDFGKQNSTRLNIERIVKLIPICSVLPHQLFLASLKITALWLIIPATGIALNVSLVVVVSV